ncbi:ABC transporter permease [Malacoplasma penetrans]|uniref:Spermidine/putrescine transport system permease PotC n=1 Tax=Malacoplasma penetrans (strain HF-2) TaxID=272633 RepID=Q8EUR1_MALP2|nr:ABC transporter permease [Malacoplasma penetrans]RXY97064.1 ABC transporter permease [Malacoplasma penetrans]BAC44651.1 spermidine/putrescine transport system permease PotC [Malacoplasma penetrans HF-2]
MHKLELSSVLNFLRRSYVYILLALIYIPLIFIIVLSFNGQSERGNILLDFTNNQMTGENWDKLFSDTSSDGFLSNLLNSILVALLVTPISVIIGLFTAFGMWNSKKKVNNIIRTASSLNISIPDIISGISLSLLLTIIWIPLGLDYGYTTVVISHVSFCTPYAIVAIYPRMASLNKNLINASNDLGASKLKTFFKVIVPHVYPSIIAAAIIVTAMSFDDFVITLLVSGNFRTIATKIYLSAKGIKAWIVTFGALLVILFITGTFILAGIKIYKEKNKKALWKR